MVEDKVLALLILGSFSVHFFATNNDNLFRFVFVFCIAMFSAICDLVVYVKSDSLNIS